MLIMVNSFSLYIPKKSSLSLLPHFLFMLLSAIPTEIAKQKSTLIFHQFPDVFMMFLSPMKTSSQMPETFSALILKSLSLVSGMILYALVSFSSLSLFSLKECIPIPLIRDLITQLSYTGASQNSLLSPRLFPFHPF
uniref:Uncharacterized protein n=1 Tax=Myotis myotis TaxID=51298 RepID=A0A7J7Z5C4_MYOMY|nr:hypothetical protein mMyoMyo1_010720 [Myotis myotis]